MVLSKIVHGKYTSQGKSKEFKCEQCPYSSDFKSSLTRHIIAMHKFVDNEEIPWIDIQNNFKSIVG